MMMAKLNTIWPELIMIATAFAVMITGLSPKLTVRRFTFTLAAGSLVVAALLVIFNDAIGLAPITPMASFMKLGILGVGFLLLLAAAETPNEFAADPDTDKPFDAGLTARGEFFGFFLLSLAGVMLCVTADDLIWLFLALELVSLPTYVMVATTREKLLAPEAGVKYFFLGAFSAAIFLYGFAMLYGATGTTYFEPLGGVVHSRPTTINAELADRGIGGLALIGLVLSFIGICFKIAAFPMHLYAADVYQGAATSVTAFLAFVPKTAGFLALLALIGTVGWPLDQDPAATDAGDGLFWMIWIVAVATMFLGNTMALRQDNLKRVLAYSSIAHSGYMLVGLLAGTTAMAASADGPVAVANGIGAVLFYLIAYGVMNVGAFAVIGMLNARGEEAETYADLNGLVRRHPGLAFVMIICMLSLAGIPPIVGFWGKFYLVGAAIGAEMYGLAVLTVLASAIAAVYYLRIIAACFLPEPAEQQERRPTPWRGVAAYASAIVVLVLSLFAGWLVHAAHEAATPSPVLTSVAEAAGSADAPSAP